VGVGAVAKAVDVFCVSVFVCCVRVDVCVRVYVRATNDLIANVMQSDNGAGGRRRQLSGRERWRRRREPKKLLCTALY
jgi:hypothetical protein